MTVIVDIDIVQNSSDSYNRKVTTLTNVLHELYHNETDFVNFLEELPDSEDIEKFSDTLIVVRGDVLKEIVDRFKLKLNLSPYEELTEDEEYQIELIY